MHYVAVCGGQEHSIEITETGPEHYVLTFEGRRIEVDARQITPTSLSLLMGESVYTAEIEPVNDTVTVRGHAVGVEVLDLRRMRLRRAKDSVAGEGGPAAIGAPMPGKVVAVLVQEGQSVEAGQGLVVVEAMKMENELRAPKAGVVRKLTAKVGAAVESGASLCLIE
jgi:biotin carboxyl carrier protein